MNAKTFISLLDVIILSLIALLHFYWVFGGKWALKDALPQNANGENVLRPGQYKSSIIPTILVAVGLLFFALIALEKGRLTNHNLPYWLSYLVSAIFGLRALGDFHYFGLFRRIKGTGFAYKDRQIYTPLCIILSLTFLYLSL